MIFQILAILLIAFSQSVTALIAPDVTSADLLWRWVICSVPALTVWGLNRFWLMSKLAETGRYTTYLLVLFIVTFVAETAICFTMNGLLTLLAEVATIYICILSLSSLRLLRTWESNRHHEESIQQQIIEDKVNERRLKVDSKLMMSELDRAINLCQTDADQAVGCIYKLSRELRDQLYGK